ncbi:MAG: alkaline phosphatase PhoX, partial [Bacteroidota bacterium]
MNINQKYYNRKEFLAFLGKATLGTMLLPPFLVGCSNTTTPISSEPLSADRVETLKKVLLEALSPSDEDDLLLTKGLNYHTVIKWKDQITSADTFGYNNDFTCFIPLDQNNPKDGLLWVNHEYVNPLFVSDFDFRAHSNPYEHRTIEQVDQEMYAVGGTIVRIREENGQWHIVENDPYNRRITAQTPIRLNWDTPIKGETTVFGTNSNCSGGITPWNTFITCEENYDACFGETEYDENNQASKRTSWYGWENFYDYPPEHYGWVVEIDPKTGSAQKHVALGRFAHECCTLYELEDKRVVAYTGDDKNDEHLYKFISSVPGSL